MSLRNLVDADCGGVNPIIGVSHHFTRDKAFQSHKQLSHSAGSSSASIGGKAFADSEAQLLVNEFITEQSLHNDPRSDKGVNQRFAMDSLLQDIHDIESYGHPINVQPFGDEQQWTDEFMASKESANELSDQLIDPFADSQNDILESAHAKWADEYLAQSEKQLAFDDDITKTMANNWTQEYDESQSVDTDLALEARNLVRAIDDPDLDETEFIKFIKKIGNSDVTISKDGNVMENAEKPKDADVWANEFTASKASIAQKWTNEFVGDKEFGDSSDVRDDDTQFWAKLAEEWKDMGLTEEHNESEHPWLTEYDSVLEPFKDGYKFNDENPLRDHPDPFEEGLKKLKEGDVPSAVLLFEAACQKDPENVMAWQYLGTSQAENEHDSAAISALKKCLDLDPNNLIAIMALAVSYTNESMQHQACGMLKEWIKRNPKYENIFASISSASSLASNTAQESFNFVRQYAVASIITSGQHQEVKDMFIAAARQSPNDPDADVQCGLGVLFNLSGEYDKAADCFQSALQVRPHDSLLWNRLGATLANGSQSEAAINAYREALSLSPGFIRSRFNLGISCINLGAHREAAEHLLTVLNVQAAGRGPQGTGARPLTSANVWSTLRMVLTLMNRADLYPAVDNRDLTLLNMEFNMDSNT